MGLFDKKVEQKYPWWVEQYAALELVKSADQVANIRAQRDYQQRLIERTEQIADAQGRQRGQYRKSAEPFFETTSDLVQQQAEAAAAGVAATPEQKALIRETAEQAIAAGESDIQAFLEETGTTLREELSPQLGLRPSDSPILDRGERARQEAVRQQGQLVRNVRGAQAQQTLDFPLAAMQVGTQARATGASMSEAARQFQQQLAQQAFQNRAAMLGQTGTQGLQLASLGGNVPIISSGSKTTDPLGQTATLLGGVGGLLTGAGAVA